MGQSQSSVTVKGFTATVPAGGKISYKLAAGSWQVTVDTTWDSTHDIEVKGKRGQLHQVCVHQYGDEVTLDNTYSWLAPKSVHVTPGTAAENAEPVSSDQRSQLFIQHVENYDAVDPTSRKAEDAVGQLPTDALQRQQKLVWIYSGDQHYYPLNKALRDDSDVGIKHYAGFIVELRNVFKSDNNIACAPFVGKVRRGITVGCVQSFLASMYPAKEFLWPQFISTSISSGFGGNIRFEISCSELLQSRAGSTMYVPKSIKHLSQYKHEEEVLFPPHVRFRVVNVKGNLVMLETVEFPSVWQAVKEKKWAEFKEWAETHPECLDTKGCEYSLINKVTEAWVGASPVSESLSAKDEAVSPEEGDLSSTFAPDSTEAGEAVGCSQQSEPEPPSEINPLEICLKHHADINEVDKQTGFTPLMHVAKQLSATVKSAENPENHQEKVKGLKEALNWCIAAGANPFQETEAGSAVQLCPEIAEMKEDTAPMKFRWDYYVDDGVDGKSTGWYPYAEAAWPVVEERYQSWCSEGGKATADVQSQGDAGTNYWYAIDFAATTQTNKSTKKKRMVRRVPFPQ